jgi:hypothetical protein
MKGGIIKLGPGGGTSMDDLKSFFEELAGGGSDDSGELLEFATEDKDKHPIVEAQMMEIDAIAERYLADIPFKVGDWIHPRKGGPLAGHGRPHKVVEVFEGQRNWNGSTAAIEHGARIDFRVITYTHGSGNRNVIATFVGERQNYELFDPKVDYKAKAKK